MAETYRTLMSPQGIRRAQERLMAVVQKEPKSIEHLAIDIGISIATLRNFMINDKKVDFVNVCKILNFIEKQETKFKIK
jgi:hypothetical protein